MKILVAEDDDDVKDLIQITLENEGHDVMTFNDGALALEATNTNYFDAFILDLCLPSVHGLSIAKKLRSDTKYKDTPIFVVSGSIDKEAINQIKHLNISAVHVKPFDTNAVALSVEDAMGKLKKIS